MAWYLIGGQAVRPEGPGQVRRHTRKPDLCFSLQMQTEFLAVRAAVVSMVNKITATLEEQFSRMWVLRLQGDDRAPPEVFR